MQRFVHFAAALFAAVWLTGCQCSRLTEHYADAVDHIADLEPSCERLYHPCFDLTRIGHPDWCRCRHNRLWCRHGCCAEAEARTELPCPFCAQYFPPYDAESVEPAGGEVEPGSEPQPLVPPTPKTDEPPTPKPAEAALPV